MTSKMNVWQEDDSKRKKKLWRNNVEEILINMHENVENLGSACNHEKILRKLEANAENKSIKKI